MKSTEPINEREQLEQAIDALETQRSILGDAVVDTAVAPLKQRLDTLIMPDQLAAQGLVSERRIVTVLFCDMVGSTTLAERLDPEAWTDIMNRVFRLLIEPVDRYGGTVTRLMGDAILALFGAPESHEDDPERAVLAGLSILENTRAFRQQFIEESGMSFDFRVGINTGLAVVGEVGSEVHVEYTAMGDSVNLAARMEQTAAPGTVQISEATYQLVADLFEVESLGPIVVKGRETPVAAYQVLGRIARHQRRGDERQAPLVGRQDEMARLRLIVDQVRDGRGQIVLLNGEAGLGKSRLIAELRAEWLASQPQDQELPRWTEMSATSYSTGRPYGTFENQMRIVAGIAPTDPAPEAREKLRQTLAADPEHEFLQSAYERLLGIHAEDQADLSSEAFMHALYDSTLMAMRNETGSRPSVFVFDDLQWVDPASLGLIEHTLQLVHELPLLILFAIRPEPGAPAWDLRQRLPGAYGDRYSEFTLNPMTDNDSIQLAHALIDEGAVTKTVRQLVLDRAEGNPFYIEELVQMLLDRDLLTPEGQSGTAAWGLSEAGDVPANLLSLVAARVDRLSREVRLTLQMAAVIGRSFYVRVLGQISEVPAALEGQLQQLEMAEMIRESNRLPEWEYIFRHALTQEAVYSSLLLEQRRRFHGLVGQALERLFPDQLREFASILAHHFDEARQMDKAGEYYILAGNEAAMLHANNQAADYYRRALTIALERGAGSELIIDLYHRLGRVLEHLHHFDEANRYYIKLEKLGQEQGDKSMVLASLASRTILHANPTSLLDPDEAEVLAIRALALAEQIGDKAAETRLYMQLSTLKSFMGNTDEAIEYGQRAMSQARDLGDKELLAQVLNDLSSHFFSIIGDFKGSIRALSEARQLWRELGDKAMETDSLSSLAEANVYLGEFDQAIAQAEEAQEISRSIHNLWGESHSQLMVGLAYWERGRPDRAIATMKKCIHLGVAAGFVVPQVATRYDLALIYATLGDAKSALKQIDLAREGAGITDNFLNVYFKGSLALVQIRTGDLHGAEVTLDGLSDRLMGGPESILDVPGFQALVEILTRQGQMGQGSKAVGQLLDFVRRVETRPYQMQALLQQAKLSRALNRPEEALASLTEARSIGDGMGSLWTMWQIEAELGRLAVDGGDIALGHFTRAREIIRSIHKHTPEHLRALFLSRPDVEAILADEHER